MEGWALFEDLAVPQDTGRTAFGAQSIPQYADPTDCLSPQIDKSVSRTTRIATSVPMRHFQGSSHIFEKGTGSKKMKLRRILVELRESTQEDMASSPKDLASDTVIISQEEVSISLATAEAILLFV